MPPRRKLIRIVIISLTAAFFVCVLSYAGLKWLVHSILPSETTKLSAYPSTLKEWSTSGLVSHFPPTIPPHATNVKFSALPGFLQGGAHIQLRMQLPPAEIEAIEEHLKKTTTQVYEGGSLFDHYNEDSKNPPTTSFHTADDPKTISFGFPTHYRLYVLSAANSGGNTWNHGKTSGTAISTTNNEVIYWANWW